ncbi:hypothetical protein JCM10207_006870 [Rhodosporidiobolus poonsookiae]
MSASIELCPSSAKRYSSSSRSERFGSGGIGGSRNGSGPGPVTPAAVASSQLMFASSSTSVGVNETEDEEDAMDAVRERVAGSVPPSEPPARGPYAVAGGAAREGEPGCGASVLEDAGGVECEGGFSGLRSGGKGFAAARTRSSSTTHVACPSPTHTLLAAFTAPSPSPHDSSANFTTSPFSHAAGTPRIATEDISDTSTTSAGGKASGMARRSEAAASAVRATKRTEQAVGGHGAEEMVGREG